MSEQNRTAPTAIVVLGILLALAQIGMMFLSMPFRLKEPNALEIFLRANSSSCRPVQLGEIFFSFAVGAAMLIGAIAVISQSQTARRLFAAASFMTFAGSFARIAYRFAVTFPLIGAYFNQLPPRDPRMKNCGFGIVMRPGEWDGFTWQLSNLSGLAIDFVFLVLSLVIVIVLCATIIPGPKNEFTTEDSENTEIGLQD